MTWEKIAYDQGVGRWTSPVVRQEGGGYVCTHIYVYEYKIYIHMCVCAEEEKQKGTYQLNSTDLL
jgi:hypothetical protein